MAEDTNKQNDAKASNADKGIALNKPMPPKPPAPDAVNKPAAPNLAAKNAVNADKAKKPSIANAAKKAANAKRIIDRRPYKAPNKKKSLIVGMLAFMLAGGAVFIMMVMMGAKDIKDQDARMNFTYGNVLAGAVAPLFEALGITDRDAANEESTRQRLAAREPSLFALNIEDWLGKKDSPAGFSGSGSGGSENAYSTQGSGDYYSSSEPMPRADFGMGGGSLGGGGGSQTSGIGKKGSNSFAGSSVKDAMDFKDDGSTKKGFLPPMKGKNALAAVKAARQMLGGALASGSANVAKSNWNAAFGQGQARATGGKTSGFGNGKIDKSAFKDANALALDRIESGEIMSLKGSELGSGNASVPDASVPAPADSAAGNKDGDSNDKLIAQMLGNAVGDAANTAVNSAFSGKGSDSASAEKLIPGENVTPPASYKEVFEGKDSILCTEGCSNYLGEEGYGVIYYKDDPVKYTITQKGAVIATMSGSQKSRDKDGNITEETYTDKYVVLPGCKPPYMHLSSSNTDASGHTTLSFKEQL